MSGISPLIRARLVGPDEMILPVSFSAKEDLACVVISAWYDWVALNPAIGSLVSSDDEEFNVEAICHYLPELRTHANGWLITVRYCLELPSK
jgi:hypothetical protein